LLQRTLAAGEAMQNNPSPAMNPSRTSGVLRAMVSSWLLLAVQVGMQFAQVPLALHYLGKDGVGVFAIVTQLISVSMLAELGASFAFGRLLIEARAEGSARYACVWSSGFTILFIQAAVIFAGMALIAPWLPGWFHVPAEFSHTVIWVFLTSGLLMVGTYTLKIYNLALFAAQRLATLNLISTVASIAQFFVGSMMLGSGLWACVHSLAAMAVVNSVGQIWICRQEGLALPLSLKAASRKEMKTIFFLGLDVFVLALFNIILSNTLILFAGLLLPFAEVTRLAINLKLQQFVIIFVQRFVSATEPPLMDLVSRGQLDRFRFAWKITTQLLLAITTIGGGFLYLWCETAVNWWTRDHFPLSRASYIWLGLLAVRFMAHSFLVSSLVMFKEIRLVRKWLLCELAGYIILSLGLGSAYGISGLIAAHVLSLLVGSLFPGQRHIARLAGFSLREMTGISLRSLLLPLGAYLALVLLFDPASGTSLTARITATTVWVTATSALIWLGILNTSERGFLTNLLQTRWRKTTSVT
jgi:O-antigen/teichoic acid export membrane protein